MNERLKVFININNKIPLKSDTSFAAQYCIRCSTYGKQSVYSQISHYISHVSLLFVDTRYHRDFTGASYFFVIFIICDILFLIVLVNWKTYSSGLGESNVHKKIKIPLVFGRIRPYGKG